MKLLSGFIKLAGMRSIYHKGVLSSFPKKWENGQGRQFALMCSHENLRARSKPKIFFKGAYPRSIFFLGRSATMFGADIFCLEQ
jgi:hypothetical protein